MVDVVETIAILACQITEAICRMRRDNRFPAERACIRFGAWKFFCFLERTGGSNQSDARSRSERFYTTKMSG